MGLFGLSIIKSKNKRNLGCKYKEQSDSICNYLSDIVKAQNYRIFDEFREHAKLINRHNEKMLSMVTDLQKISTKKEVRLTRLEAYVKPMNMVVFDSFLRFKWVFLAWIIFETAISLGTLIILALHIAK